MKRSQLKKKREEQATVVRDSGKVSERSPPRKEVRKERTVEEFEEDYRSRERKAGALRLGR